MILLKTGLITVIILAIIISCSVLSILLPQQSVNAQAIGLTTGMSASICNIPENTDLQQYLISIRAGTNNQSSQKEQKEQVLCLLNLAMIKGVEKDPKVIEEKKFIYYLANNAVIGLYNISEPTTYKQMTLLMKDNSTYINSTESIVVDFKDFKANFQNNHINGFKFVGIDSFPDVKPNTKHTDSDNNEDNKKNDNEDSNDNDDDKKENN